MTHSSLFFQLAWRRSAWRRHRLGFMKNNLRPLFETFPAILAALLFLTTPVAADDPATASSASVTRTWHYLEPDSVSPAALLAPPPLPGSAEQAADMESVWSVYRTATSNDIAAAYSQRKFDVFVFAPVVGDFFQPGKLPVTEAFLRRVQEDSRMVTDSGKNYFRRSRPFVTDPRLANGPLEASYSYPSGHSTESMVLALVLAELFPEQRDALIAEARDIGWHRVQIARHYPTDIYAGRVLAQAIVRKLNACAAFRQDLAAARAEITAAKETTAR